MSCIYAGNQVPKGSYMCKNCGEVFNAEEKMILKSCASCGCDEFKSTILMELSDEEIKEKINDCIKLTAISSYLYEKLNMNEFINVMAINLRILLCDKEGSLLPRIVENPTFQSGIFDNENNVIFPDKLFKGMNRLDINDFLSQVVVKRPGKKPVTVGKMIRAVANKCGGAHIDTELYDDFYLASSASKHYFTEISKYIVNMAGYDYDAIVDEYLTKIRSI